jgi:hypothetical protein
MRFPLFALLVCTTASAEPTLCRGDAGLAGFAGFYAHQVVIAQAHRTRSWPATVAAAGTHEPGIVVTRKDVLRVEGWHEQPSGGNCITPEGTSVWLHIAKLKAKAMGPYLKIAGAEHTLPTAYLTLIAGGCYLATDKSKWCIDSTGVTINGKPIGWKFELDLSELPEYGTSLVDRKAQNQLLVLAPTATGFDVYKDTWMSADNRKPAGPGESKPWVSLRPLR